MAGVLTITVTRSLHLLQDPSELAQTEESPDLFLSLNTFGATESSELVLATARRSRERPCALKQVHWQVLPGFCSRLRAW